MFILFNSIQRDISREKYSELGITKPDSRAHLALLLSLTVRAWANHLAYVSQSLHLNSHLHLPHELP